MKPDIKEIAESIRKDMESRKVGVNSAQGNTPTNSLQPSPSMTGKIQMWVNMCLEYDLATNVATIIKGPWTKLAGNNQTKKKPPKAPKIAEEVEADATEKI